MFERPRQHQGSARATAENTERRTSGEDTDSDTAIMIHFRIDLDHEHRISIHHRDMFKIDTILPEYESSAIITIRGEYKFVRRQPDSARVVLENSSPIKISFAF